VSAPPLVILGLDSGDPDLLLRWAAEGHLPTVASLLERGAIARLTGPEMITAHGVWLSLWSGASVTEHGHYLRRPLVPGTYETQRLHPSDTGAPPFWSRFVGGRRRVLVVDAPETWPLKGLPGLQLANWGGHPRGFAPISEPIGLVSEVGRRFGPQILTDESQRSRMHDRRACRRILQRIESKGALVRHLLEQGPFDLVIVVFGDPHAAGHRFWKYGLDVGPERRGRRLERAVYAIFRALDRELGSFLERLPEANVLLVSNHGIRDGYPTGELVDAFCHRLGYMVGKEPARRPAGRIARHWRVMPDGWRAGLGRWLPSRWANWLEAHRHGGGTDWSRTIAFPIRSHYTGLLRVNLKGREPLGVVEPGQEYESVLARLEGDLRALVDESSREPVVESVTRATDLFGGGPPSRLPDLFVEWRADRDFLGRVLHPRVKLTQRRYGSPRGNHHSRVGQVIAAGPSISARGRVGDLSPLDFVPLFLLLMGEPVPAGGSRLALESFLETDLRGDITD
jgi:predicted AlkP superfamily phosphohydrolase/phosphomutase